MTLPDGVLTIGNNAFYQCGSMSSMTIPSSVEKVGRSAFGGCYSMDAINVDPANLNYASIGGILYDKSFTNLIQCPCAKEGAVTIPNSVTRIEDNAFYHCSSLTNVSIPNGVEYIGDSAFYYCGNLASLMIPDSVNYIGYQAFASCIKLIEIEVHPANPEYASMEGVLYDKPMTTLIQCPSGKGGPFSIPSGVTTIEDYAFYLCNLTSVIVPASVLTIGYRALDGLKSMTQIQFIGNAPLCDDRWIQSHNVSLKIYYAQGSIGFTSPTWYGIDTVALLPVSGKVVDGDGNGIAGIKITLDDTIWVMTDSEGNFSLLTSEGGHNLNFTGQGYENRTMDISVSGTGLSLEDVEMDRTNEGSDDGSDNMLMIAIAVGAIVASVVGLLVILRWRKNKT
jgi:hypothetical protein